MEKIYDFVFCTYIIPMVIAAIMSMIDIYFRAKNADMRFCSSVIKGYFIRVFVPLVNIIVCGIGILMIIDEIAYRLEKYLKGKI